VALFGEPQRLLRLLALDELPDLAADRAHDLQQHLVGLLDVPPVELHDAERQAARNDGEAERAVQVRPRRSRPAAEIGPLRDIGEPYGRAGLPYGAYEPSGASPGRRAVAPWGGLVAALAGGGREL